MINELVKKFSSAADKLMSEVHSRQTGLHMVLVNSLLKTKKEYKKLKKQKINEIFIETNSTKVTFRRTSLMEIGKI